MPSTSHEVSVGSYAWLKIIIDETSHSEANNSSQVRVRGVMRCSYASWHSDANVSRSISGSGSYSPGGFSFNIGDGGSYTFIDHTFTIGHNSDGTKTVNFTVHYGVTGLSNFGDNKSCSDSLTLTRLGSVPDHPGQPVFSNITPTSLTVSWDAPADDGGSSITTYELRRWTGGSQSGSYVDSKGNSRTRNVTGLTPGGTYTFAVHAQNGVGWSSWSTDNHVTLSAGAMIRVGEVWKMGIPYVRVNGVWKQAIPYIRQGGTWHPAN
jgi:Fibronectin type III domain/Siphovirus protein of unknown function (DUF859)